MDGNSIKEKSRHFPLGDDYLAQFVTHEFEALPDKRELFNKLWKDYYDSHGEPADPLRVFNMMVLVNIANKVKEDGDYLELGVHRGFVSKLIWELMDKSKTLYLFDTFEGFKEKDLVEERKVYANNWVEGNFLPTSTEEVKRYVTKDETDNIKIIKGWFPESFSGYENKKWRFVHIDFDLYAPIKAALEIIWSQLLPGGVVVIHDYGCYGFPGAKKAVDEFFDTLGIVPLPLCDRWGSAVVIKNKKAKSRFF